MALRKMIQRPGSGEQQRRFSPAPLGMALTAPVQAQTDAAQIWDELAAGSSCVDFFSGTEKRISTRMLEQETQTPSPAPDLIPG